MLVVACRCKINVQPLFIDRGLKALFFGQFNEFSHIYLEIQRVHFYFSIGKIEILNATVICQKNKCYNNWLYKPLIYTHRKQ